MIPMEEFERRKQIFEKLQFCAGNAEILCRMPEQRPMQPFAEETITFLSAWSSAIRRDPQARQMTDAASFGFWCRNASLAEQKKMCGCEGNGRLGRGVTLHFAPSNIPMLFAYSLSSALLAGNCAAVRLPSRDMPETDAVIRVLNQVLEENTEWKNRIACFRYNYDREVTDELSQLCDVRIIWGGDASVSEIRQSPLLPYAADLPFANRNSAAVFSADAVLATENLTDLVRKFYNDTYLNDQNACSSPQILYWLGSENKICAAKERFWEAVFEYVKLQYTIQPDLAVKKWENALLLAAFYPDVQVIQQENYIVRVQMPELRSDLCKFVCAGGFFIESSGTDIQRLLPVLGKKCQTLVAYGIESEKIAGDLFAERIFGVDRVVEVGHALDFSLIWDGRNLIEEMSRKCLVLG